MRLGHIGVRAGSKGVPGKNFLNICGKPLIDWSLDQLFAAPEIDAVVVSTDSPEMYDHAVAKGALKMGLRPAELANDSAAKLHVWQHALDVCEGLIGPVDTFIDLDCTAPLRAQEDITNAIALFDAEKPDMVMPCCEAHKNPYFNLLEADETGNLRVSKPLPGAVVARQHAPQVWAHAGGTYVLSADYVKRAKTLFDGRVIPYEMPPERCVDIDSPFDLKIARFLLSEREGVPA